MAYGILIHKVPVVAVMFSQSNDNEGTMKNILTMALHTVVQVLELQKFASREVRNLSREVIPLTHSESSQDEKLFYMSQIFLIF